MRGVCDVSRDTSRAAAVGAIDRGAPSAGVVRCAVQGAAETEVTVPGQLALVIETEMVVPAAVWETLPPERQLQLALRLARLLARLVEAARDE